MTYNSSQTKRKQNCSATVGQGESGLMHYAYLRGICSIYNGHIF